MQKIHTLPPPAFRDGPYTIQKMDPIVVSAGGCSRPCIQTDVTLWIDKIVFHAVEPLVLAKVLLGSEVISPEDMGFGVNRFHIDCDTRQSFPWLAGRVWTPSAPLCLWFTNYKFKAAALSGEVHGVIIEL